MTTPTMPPLAITHADAECAIVRLQEFVSLLIHHEKEPRRVTFLLGEVEAAADILAERIADIGKLAAAEGEEPRP